VPIFNTYQASLRDCPSRLALALARAERERWVLGVKLVRGAYVGAERARAAARAYHDPTQPSLAATAACFDACADAMLDAAARGRGALCVASHNGAALARAAAGAASRGLTHAAPRAPGGVSFAQLYGMGDAHSFALSRAGAAVFKYVPWGPPDAVLPYLLRRAEENSDLLAGNVRQEIAALEAELVSRATGRA
jgi:proline dehydrogenase